MTDEQTHTAGEATANDEDTPDIQLTDEQRDALLFDRNLTITAGAGTGKTTTLTQRYLEFLRSHPDATPENVVTITFTRKAAAELQQRVREEVYNELAAADSPAAYSRWRAVLDEIDDSYTHTIHAFCARLLRENAVQAPVPVEFDVLDADGAMDLQREVVVDYLDANGSNPDVDLLSRLFGSRDKLTDILVELLAARPESEAWVDEWGGQDVDAYLSFLWEHACELDPDTARDCLTAAPVQDAFATARRFADTEFDVEAGADGVALLRDIADIVDQIEEPVDDRAAIQHCRALYDILEKRSGGLYASASHHLIGTKADWNSETDAYDDCKAALGALMEELRGIEAQLQTVPGTIDRNSAHYVVALASVFEEVLTAYAAEKEQRDALDFPDLIETSITFLEESPTIRASLRDQFAAVMVDEFQDTDQHQWQLIALLTGLADSDTDTETDNVFLVGDKKQSIYGFRGAEVTTFDDAADTLTAANQRLGRGGIPEGTQDSPTGMELSGNFRTLDGTLTFLNELFDQVFEPLGEEYEPYEARPQSLSFERDRIETVGDHAGSVEYLLVPEQADDAEALLGADHPVVDAAAEHSIAGEAQALGDRLSTLLSDPPTIIDEETGEQRPAEPSDVAILLRRRTHLDRYQRALEAHDLPYSVISGVGFYETPEVQALTNLLRMLADPDDDISLYGVLRSPLFGFTDGRLSAVAQSAESLWEGINAADDQQLAEAASLLTKWRELAGCVDSASTDVRPWNRVLTQVIDDTGYLVSVGAGESGQQAVANVEKFRDEIREWSEGGTRTAASLLRRIDRRAEIDPQEGDASIPDGADGIRIMTIHAAKGLEFPIVTVPDIGSRLNFGRSIDDHGHVRLITDHDAAPFLTVSGPSPEDPFDTQQTIAHGYADDIEQPRERAEAKRLLYVACTRARDHLLLCGTHKFDDAGEPTLAAVDDADAASTWRDWLQPILLDDELVAAAVETGNTQAQLGDATYTVRLPGDGVQWTAENSPETGGELPHITIPDRPESGSRTRVTATQLVQAADASSTEPSRSETSQSDESSTLPRHEFGTIVHRVLEFDADAATWPGLIRRIANVNGFDVTDETVAAIIDHVDDATAFLTDVASTSPEATTYEELSVSVDVGSHRIVGDIDHLRVTPDVFIITDYKTNRLGQRTPQDLADHYRPQMMSYALALLQSDSDREVIAHLRFTTVGETVSFQWSDSDQAALQQELTSIATRIE